MPKLDKGKVLLRCAAHALFVGLRVIPGVGMAVEIAHGWFDIFRDELRKAGFKERLLQLEEAAAISPSEARVIADEFIAEQRAQDVVISEEKANAICDLLTFMPATIKERTQATLRQARQRGTALQTVLPITVKANPLEQETFYRSLFPARRPRFQSGYSVPNGLAGWRLGSLLGTGGFGEVWEVRHERLRYAVKFFLDEVSERILKNEAKTLFDVHDSLPRHANIVHLIALNLDKPPYWLLFEFVEGGALESLLRAAPLAWQESLDLFRPIVEGVAAVHRIGIVHRDLKPANILLTVDGIPKITDFGIGKLMAENEAVMRVSRSQSTMLGFGSMGYMSKEQRRGESAHPTDDTYALGVLLWQMLVQTLEAPDLDWAEELQQQDVPETLKNVVFACLNKSREQRPADAVALLEMLPTTASSGLQEMEATQDGEAAQQRELARKQRQVESESARQAMYAASLEHAQVERAEINAQAEARLAELRRLVAQKRQRSDAPLQLQEAMEELRQVEALIEKIEADYSQEQTVHQQKIEHGLQKALAELGEFKSAPHDRFEKTEEYEQRFKLEKADYTGQQDKIKTSWQQAREKLDKRLEEARLQDLEVLQKQRTLLLNKQFDVPPAQLELKLLDYDADKELLRFEMIAEEIVPGKRYCTVNAALTIAPKEAKICWQRWEEDKQLLVPYLVLGINLVLGISKPRAIKAGFETVEGQLYFASSKLRVEKSAKAKAEKAEQQQKELERQQREFEKVKLSPWNPLDWMKLLWWVLVMPQQLNAYQQTYGVYAKVNVKDIWKWLATSTLILLPLSLATLAMGMELLPLREEAKYPQSYLIATGMIVIAWLVTRAFFALFDEDEDAKLVFVIVGIMAFLVVLSAVSGRFGVLYSMAFCLGVGVVGVVKDSIKNNQPSFVARIAFVLLLSFHAFVIWFFYLGGWQMFK